MIEQLKQTAETLKSLLLTYGSEMRRADRVAGEEALAKALDTIAEAEQPGLFDEFSATEWIEQQQSVCMDMLDDRN